MEFPNFVSYRGENLKIFPEDKDSDGYLDAKDYFTGEKIAYFPDLKKISKAIGGARNLHKYWNSLSREDKVDMLEQAGVELNKIDNYDELISRAGGFPIKHVKNTRQNFGEYLKQAENLLQKTPGNGPMVGATSVTTPDVQPYIMIESLFGNCSVTEKGDSQEPFSAYIIGEVGYEVGLPVQFVTYSRTDNKKDFGSQLYKLCEQDDGYFILMGDPATPKKIAYRNLLDDADSTKLPLPKNMINFVSHGGAIIVDENADLEKATDGTIESFKYPKLCKAPTGIFVDERIADEYIDKLNNKINKQKVGDVTDKETDIAKVSQEYWDKLVDPFMRAAKSTTSEVVEGGKINQPTILKGHFNNSLAMEPHWPIYCIEPIENKDEAFRKINRTAKQSTKGKILELSVFTKDDELFKEIQEQRRKGDLGVYTLHKNKPTYSMNPEVGHEGIILRKYLAEENFVDK